MFWINIKRILKSGFISFWRNGFVSFSAVLVMAITLFVIGSVTFLSVTLDTVLTDLKNKVDINIYFVSAAEPEEILSLKSSIEKLPEVSLVEYVSREKALENFKERHKNEQLTLQALEELDDNPLGAILNVKAKDPSQYANIASFIENDNSLSKEGIHIIDDVNYNNNKVAIDRLTKIINSADKIGFWISLILIALSVAITFNTIRLTIYIAREEISVMRLVGASDRYIRGPFIIIGILYGIVAGLFTLVIYYPITLWLKKITGNFYSNLDLFDYYVTNFGQFFLIIIISGIAIGALSSYLAVRRYLNSK